MLAAALIAGLNSIAARLNAARLNFRLNRYGLTDVGVDIYIFPDLNENAHKLRTSTSYYNYIYTLHPVTLTLT